jgi:hypothetical protein
MVQKGLTATARIGILFAGIFFLLSLPLASAGLIPSRNTIDGNTINIQINPHSPLGMGALNNAPLAFQHPLSDLAFDAEAPRPVGNSIIMPVPPSDNNPGGGGSTNVLPDLGSIGLVPESPTIMLFVGGLGWLTLLMRRRRSS